MSTHTYKISLGHVDVSRLETDDDFRREAQRRDRAATAP
jgi:hypothetical protein